MANLQAELRALFCEALDRDTPQKRAEYLDHACRGEPGLRARVEALLQAHDEASGFLNEPCGGPVATIDDPSVSERPGTVVGPYKLLEQIGEGGFGIVFMAEQMQPIRRKVALKVLKPGMDTRQVVARFEAERQALALMDHPHIARVFDGGETATGRPYFVMELVRGIAITDFCDQNRLLIRERLELFVNVCQAVQHAHQKGVIHRDIKPSNVMVTLHDGTPVVKVIDFGIAKATGKQLTDKTLFTHFAQMIGTPLYMSPEQAGISGLDVDTRSDIYSLGVLLYELLTGTTPFDRERLREADYDEIRRIIREEEPAKPSTRISTMGQAATTISTQRRSDPKRISQLLRGELDWIVMKALEKDRNRRYETASGLAMDVQRYLADEPVQACPPSVRYRLRKFARRHKTGLAIANLIVFFIAVLGGGGGWVLRDREARAQEAAQERREREQRLTTQVELILDEVDRLERAQKWPEAQAAAERAEAVLAGSEAGDDVRRRVGEARRDLAFVTELDRIRQERTATVEGQFNNAGASRDYAKAFRDYGVDMESLPPDEAVALLRGHPALTAPVAAALDDWAYARQELREDASTWKPLFTAASALDPDPLLNRLKAMWGWKLTPESKAEVRRLAESIDVKAQRPFTIIILARALTAADLSDSAVRILQAGQYAHPADFWLDIELAGVLQNRRDYAGAVRYSTGAVSVRPDSAAAHSNLGLYLCEQGKLDEAVAECRKAIDLDPKHAGAHCNLGKALDDQGKVDEAVAEWRKAIELGPKNSPPHFNLGRFLSKQGKLDEAVAEYRLAVKFDPTSAGAHESLGVALSKQGKLDEAVAAYRKAIEIDPKDADAHNRLGNVLRRQGKVDEAVAEHRKTIELAPKDALAHNNLGGDLEDQGKPNEAIAEFRKAIELDPKFAGAHSNLGGALYRLGKWDEAGAEYRKAIEIDPKNADAHDGLGIALRHQGKVDEAVAEHRKAIELAPKFEKAYYNLGLALVARGDLAGAAAGFRTAISLKPDYALAHCGLSQILLKQGQFRAALAEMRRGHELGFKNPNWPYPSAQAVRHCERLVELDERLPGFLDGKTMPASAAERVEIAGLCILKRLYRAAARFYEEAFGAAPKLADDLGAAHRYNAACAAALAGCAQGKDADQSDAKERARLRRQALDWLRADLAVWSGLLEKESEKIAPVLAKTMQHWQQDTDFAGVRGPDALARLPEAERRAWQMLWKDVSAMLKQTQGKRASEKK